MRVKLQCLVQHETSIRDVLEFVSQSWEEAQAISGEVDALNRVWITTPEIKSDDILAIRTSILLREMKTKVEATYEVSVGGHGDGGEGLQMQMRVDVKARVVYGEELNEGKMGAFLTQKIGKKGGSWAGGVKELEERLIARGSKEKKTE